MRFYEPAGGTILIDGRDIREYSVAGLRTAHQPRLPEPIIFHDSLRRTSASEEEDDLSQVRDAARIAHATGFINSSRGSRRWLGERGITLSGGRGNCS